tara:strand:+ start:392 stop:589 length:198 start_codon:yes stop_codon:yes gene_type:complete
MNIIETRIKNLLQLLSANEHMDREKKQKVWDLYLRLLRFTNLLDKNQQLALNKAKRFLLNNKRWV